MINFILRLLWRRRPQSDHITPGPQPRQIGLYIVRSVLKLSIWLPTLLLTSLIIIITTAATVIVRLPAFIQLRRYLHLAAGFRLYISETVYRIVCTAKYKLLNVIGKTINELLLYNTLSTRIQRHWQERHLVIVIFYILRDVEVGASHIF